MVKISKIEALRGIAALYVMLHHFNIGEGSWIKYFTQQGQIAVILFFFLSGFVLHISSHEGIQSGKLGFKKYFTKRFRRIYPVLLISMVISYLAFCAAKQKLGYFNWPEFFANVLNVQDLERHPGYWYEAFAGNTPLWSLSYEWWFYMIFFPIARYVPENKQKLTALLLTFAGFLSYWLFPNQFSIILEYFIIWWIGIELGKAWQSNQLLSKPVVRFAFGSLFILLALQVIRAYFYAPGTYPSYHPELHPDYDGRMDPLFYPNLNVLHTAYALFILAVGYVWYKLSMPGYNTAFRYFAFFAPISYSIYVFHYPMVMRYKYPFFPNLTVQYLVCVPLLALTCYLVEVRLQKSINKVFR